MEGHKIEFVSIKFIEKLIKSQKIQQKYRLQKKENKLIMNLLKENHLLKLGSSPCSLNLALIIVKYLFDVQQN